MCGLDNPRRLAFGPEGALYVTEAGHGGDGPCAFASDGVRFCYGPTGSVSRLWCGEVDRFATGLPSIAINDSRFLGRLATAASGPQGIALLGRGGAYVTIGLRENPAFRAGFGDAGAGLAQLVHVAASGEWRFIADIGTYEAAVNPVGTPDSNPYAVLAEPGGRFVADSGANALFHVAANGEISTMAVFPSRPERPTDAVPTSIARGPDGAYYVGELTGVPFATFDAGVYRVVPGQVPEIPAYLHGFRMIIDIAFDAEWNLYVLEYATVPAGNPLFGRSGTLVKVALDHSRSIVKTGLQLPTSVAIDADGFVYVTLRGNNRGSVGEVVRIDP
jgi:hypothetical protein